MTSLAFDNPLAWIVGLPLAVAVLVLSGFCHRRLGCDWRQTATLVGLRAIALLILVMLVARPMWVTPEQKLPERDQVVLLVDRSESMSLADASSNRYHAAVESARTGLMPAFEDADLRVELMTFAEDAEAADGAQIAGAAPDGKRTNLARAVARSLIERERPPLAVMALTDGATTDEGRSATTRNSCSMKSVAEPRSRIEDQRYAAPPASTAGCWRCCSAVSAPNGCCGSVGE